MIGINLTHQNGIFRFCRYDSVRGGHMVIDEVFSEKYPADLEPFMTQTTQSSEMLIPPVIFSLP